VPGRPTRRRSRRHCGRAWVAGAPVRHFAVREGAGVSDGRAPPCRRWRPCCRKCGSHPLTTGGRGYGHMYYCGCRLLGVVRPPETGGEYGVTGCLQHDLSASSRPCAVSTLVDVRSRRHPAGLFRRVVPALVPPGDAGHHGNEKASVCRRLWLIWCNRRRRLCRWFVSVAI